MRTTLDRWGGKKRREKGASKREDTERKLLKGERVFKCDCGNDKENKEE